MYFVLITDVFVFLVSLFVALTCMLSLRLVVASNFICRLCWHNGSINKLKGRLQSAVLGVDCCCSDLTCLFLCFCSASLHCACHPKPVPVSASSVSRFSVIFLLCLLSPWACINLSFGFCYRFFPFLSLTSIAFVASGLTACISTHSDDIILFEVYFRSPSFVSNCVPSFHFPRFMNSTFFVIPSQFLSLSFTFFFFNFFPFNPYFFTSISFSISLYFISQFSGSCEFVFVKITCFTSISLFPCIFPGVLLPDVSLHLLSALHSSSTFFLFLISHQF